MLNIECIRPDKLTPAQINDWRALCAGRLGYDSPCFDPQFAISLANFRPQVEVALASAGNELVAVFAFERHGATAKPLGIKLADFQGVIVRDGVTIDTAELLKGCGLSSWQFDHRLIDESQASVGSSLVSESRYLNIADGFEAYKKERAAAGTMQVKQAFRKRRKMEREVGEIRFVHQEVDRAVFDQLIEWKSAQRKRTETFDILQFDWVQEFLWSLVEENSPHFRGALSAMYVNDEFAAVHLGIASPTAFHYWFPAYTAELYKYSPGVNLLLMITEEEASRGLQRVDLGKGDEPYKASFASGSLQLEEGCLDLNPTRAFMNAAVLRTRQWMKATPLYDSLRKPKRWIRSLAHRKAMS